MADFWAGDPVVAAPAPMSSLPTGANSPPAGSGNFWSGDPIVSPATAKGAPVNVAALASAPDDGQSTWEGIAAQIPAGLDQFAYNVMGAPVDLTRGLINGVTAPTRDAAAAASAAGRPGGSGFSIPEIPSGTVGSSDWWANVFNHIAGTPIPSQVPMRGEAERATRAAVQGAAMAAVPESAFGAGAEALGLGANAGVSAARALGAPATLASGARMAAMGAGAGAGSQLASDAVPDQYKPLAGMAGGMAGGILADVPALAGGTAAARIKSAVQPMTKAGQEAMAGDVLYNAATSPEAAINAIGENQRELVPGSQPLTAQLSDDMGLAGLERAVAAKNPEMFAQARADQNAARLDALANLQANGDPQAVANMVRGLSDHLDQQTQALYDQRAQVATGQASVPTMGGGTSPEAIGSTIQSAVNPQIEAAQNAAREGLDQIGGLTTAAMRGEQAQQAIQQGIDALTARKNALYDAVDPNHDLQMVSTPLNEALESVYGDMGPAKLSTLSPAERNIQQIIAGYGPVIPFQEGRDLSSVISGAMREARSPLTPNYAAYGRLSQLRGAVEDAISNSIEGRMAEEQQAVASGAMSPEDTMAARAQGWVNSWYANREAGSSNKFGTGENAASGPAAVSGTRGTTRQGGSGPANDEGSQGLSGDAGSGPFIDQEAAARLKAANAANKELRATEGAKPVAGIIQRPGPSYPYTMAPETAAGHLWQPGPKGAASVKAILKASQGAPEAIEAIRESAAADLRSQAPDGILTPQKFAQWRARHGEALAALEAASPGTIARFENAAKAADSLRRFDGFDQRVPASALPERYFSTGDKGFQTVNDLRSLIGKDKADHLLSDYAADSLRRHAMRPDGTIDPVKLAAWRKTHSGALSALPEAGARFSSAGQATEALDTAAHERRAALDAFQKSALGKLMKLDNPDDVTRAVGSIFGRNNAVQSMRELATAAKENPEALAGLRKAIVDFMSQKLISNTEAATSGRNLIKSDQFQTFIGKNATALRQVFNDDEIRSMRAIAQDLRRANRTITAARLPGGSNTAQDMAGMGKHILQPTILNRLLELGTLGGGGAGALIGHGFESGVTGALAGAAAGQVAHWVANLRAAGIENANGLVRRAMLDPEFAKTLLMKASGRAGSGSDVTFQRRLARMALQGTAAAN